MTAGRIRARRSAASMSGNSGRHLLHETRVLNRAAMSSIDGGVALSATAQT